MKSSVKLCFLTFLVVINLSAALGQQKTDLSAKWDTIRPLENPDKGWYHHMYDNGIGRYLIQDKKDLISFPGMDHLYLRLCWAYLEPEEGKFNWAIIDTIINKYVTMGYGISFRITCKETGPAPMSVPLKVNGIRYATPYWVRQAGAKGVERPKFGSPSWTPVWDDPVFLEKLNNFHKAFAARYDGKPWVRYIDVGSIGDWGEGHTHSSTRIPPTVKQVKANLDIYLKNYKKTQLVVSDDLLYWGKSKHDVQILYDYALKNGFTVRDDSPMVKYYMENYFSTWTVSNPEFYDPLYLKRPIVFELEHYKAIKANGFWLGKNGRGIIPGYGYSGAEIFRNAMELEHATYIGFHGYLGDWLKDNPTLTVELLNRCGYWYFPKSVSIKEASPKSISFEIDWLNKGIAPAYNVYQLRVKLNPDDPSDEPMEFVINDSGNKKWLPWKTVQEDYTINPKGKLKGNYQVAIQLYDTRSSRPVEIGLTQNIKIENYFNICKVSF